MKSIQNNKPPCTNCSDRSQTIWVFRKGERYLCPTCEKDFTEEFLEVRNANTRH